MAIETGLSWRSAGRMSALFLASFTLTLWLERPATLAASSTDTGMPEATGNARNNPLFVDPAAAPLRAANEPAELPLDGPSPTLQDLLTDDDPALREESRAVLAVLQMEATAD